MRRKQQCWTSRDVVGGSGRWFAEDGGGPGCGNDRAKMAMKTVQKKGNVKLAVTRAHRGLDWKSGVAHLKGLMAPYALTQLLRRGLRAQAFVSMVAADASSTASAHDLLPLSLLIGGPCWLRGLQYFQARSLVRRRRDWNAQCSFNFLCAAWTENAFCLVHLKR